MRGSNREADIQAMPGGGRSGRGIREMNRGTQSEPLLTSGTYEEAEKDRKRYESDDMERSGGDEDDLDGPREKRVSIDDAIEQHVPSGMGWGQVKQYVGAALAWVPSAPLTLLLVFAARDLEKECTPASREECEERLEKGQGFCDMPRRLWRFTNPNESLVAEFDLTCDREWMTSLLNSGFFLAFFFGCSIMGYASDRFGRRKTLLLSIGLAAIFTSASAFAPSFVVFAVLRSLSGAAAAGIGLASFVLSTEHIGSSRRGIAGVATQYFWAAGVTILPLLALLCDHLRAAWPPSWRPFGEGLGWRGLTQCVAALNMVYALATIPGMGLLRESPRWLAIQGKLSKAHAVLKSIAPVGTIIPELTQLDESGQGETQSETLFVLRKYPNLALRLLGMMAEWMTISMGYYGLSLGAGQLGSNLYMTSFLSGLVEIPSYVLANVLIEWWGRRNSLMALLLLAGGCCIGAGFTHPASRTRTAVSLTGKFGVAGAFNLLFLFTSELFPTSLRTAALGSCSQAARIGAIAAPAVLLLRSFPPLTVLGLGVLLAGTITLAFPEPLGQPLPDSLATAEATPIPGILDRPGSSYTASSTGLGLPSAVEDDVDEEEDEDDTAPPPR